MLATLFALPAIAAALPAGTMDFEKFKRMFRRNYAAGEEPVRRAIFEAEMSKIEAHNAAEFSWKMGVNQFSDWTWDEFKDSILMEAQNCSATSSASQLEAKLGSRVLQDIPDALDWRERGIVSEVKNQGSCGSCWTFSTVGALEAHLALKADPWRAPRLSEQQLVDCAFNFDTAGCNGGLPSHAFEYIKHAGGLSTEFAYPYVAETKDCSFSMAEDAPVPEAQGVGIIVPGGSVNLTAGDEKQLQMALATAGPVSVAFQVASDFKSYASGVYTSTVCKDGPMDVNHAVLAVGYGTDVDLDMPYWTIKNSWDFTWGADGYFKMEAFKNMCGVANCNSYPDLYGM